MSAAARRRRPGGARLALLAAISIAWLACFALHLDAVQRGRLAWIPVSISGATDERELPLVGGFWSDDDRRRSTVSPGDALAKAGERPLAGSRGLALAARIHAAADASGRVPVAVARDQGVEPAVLALRPVPHAWRLSLLAAVLFAAGAIAAWRAPRTPAAWLVFLALAAYSFHLAYFWGGGEARNLAAYAVFAAGLALALPLVVRAALAFPDDLGRRSRLARYGPWLFAAAGVGAPSWAFGWPLATGTGFALTVGGSVAALLAVAAAAALQWRRSGPIGRRQIKWLVVGALAGFAPPVLTGAAALARPEWWWLYELSVTAVLLAPIALVVALVRDRLFDVDRLVTAAGLYTGLCILLLGTVIGVVPRVAALLDGVVERSVSEPALALVSAVVLLGARARIEPGLARRLYPERERFERGAASLRDALARCEKPAELFVAIGERLDALLAPESLVVFGRGVDAFAPIWERGRAVVPGLALDGPLACELEGESRVLDVSSLAAGAHLDPLHDLECRALEAMGTELVLPVVGQRLEGFVCIGPLRSGLPYGSAELALLQSIADKAADALRRFDLEELERDQRALCERLRRYVPAALAQRLASGRELPSGEREVTVLFVDVRGYVGLAERRAPGAVFSFVGRYARATSEILRRHGGTIIDVQGDGLLSVFGAPDAQPDKEQRALAAARELLVAVPSFGLDPDGCTSEPIDVGIGIATGPAFVGPLATADRAFWVVVGDTVNLAARYQALTREVDAWLVADARTWASAGAPSDLVPLPRMAIRGRRGRVDLHRLPAGSVPAPPSPEAYS